MLRPGIPEKTVKDILSKKQEGPIKNNKTRHSQRIGGLITSQPIRSMGI
jgi:hypothetical protein